MPRTRGRRGTQLSDYLTKYETIRMRREEGILEVAFHTEGGPLRWGRVPHAEIEEAFLNIARDRENKVVIMTGTGSEFSGPLADPATNPQHHKMSSGEWEVISWEMRNILMHLLAIEVPMISAVNGPAVRHAELPIMCDVVLAAEEALFQDSAHFIAGLVPGDGVHVAFQLAMGYNRARYFLLTGQTLTARDAKVAGLVNEVVPRHLLLPRAWEIARSIALQPEFNRRYARMLLTDLLRRQMRELQPYGLALEGLALPYPSDND
ncbi:MAG: enoyl-CoA hydratase/isomerase family protein [Burkholderiales bacterium]|nr:enoyl-CoA hydratase/isomerase family protein [Burkholderiales bacterium]